jgi:hypothetical protein
LCVFEHCAVGGGGEVVIVQCFTIGGPTAEVEVEEEEDFRNRSSRRRQDSWISEDMKLREKPVVLISTSRRARSGGLWMRDVPVTDIVKGVVISKKSEVEWCWMDEKELKVWCRDLRS